MSEIWAAFGELEPDVQAVYLAALIGFTGAILTLVITIYSQRKLTRIRETYSTIHRNLWDKDYIDAWVAYMGLAEEIDKRAADLASPQTDADKSKAHTIKKILNDYEITAIGIKKGILDESF